MRETLDQSVLERLMSDEELGLYREVCPEVHLRSKEEALYYRLFREVFPKSEHIIGNIGRWSDRPQLSPLPS